MTRKEAIKILENDIVDGHVEGTPTFMDAFWMAVDALKQLSSYEQTINKLTDAISKQEPKTGHWRAVTQGDEVISYRCSCCGYSSKNNYEWKYCPNCGADMRGETK